MNPQISAIALDVDGVLTDNTFTWGSNGEEYKSFSFADVMGIARARQRGVIFALVSGEDSPLVTRFAEKLGIEYVRTGCKDKGAALKDFAQQFGLELSTTCFMGNDINDVDAMKLVGVAAAPADAHQSALSVAAVVTESRGGHGAVREIIDRLLLAAER